MFTDLFVKSLDCVKWVLPKVTWVRLWELKLEVRWEVKIEVNFDLEIEYFIELKSWILLKQKMTEQYRY